MVGWEEWATGLNSIEVTRKYEMVLYFYKTQRWMFFGMHIPISWDKGEKQLHCELGSSLETMETAYYDFPKPRI
jgi:hypothetical protein